MKILLNIFYALVFFLVAFGLVGGVKYNIFQDGHRDFGRELATSCANQYPGYQVSISVIPWKSGCTSDGKDIDCSLLECIKLDPLKEK